MSVYGVYNGGVKFNFTPPQFLKTTSQAALLHTNFLQRLFSLTVAPCLTPLQPPELLLDGLLTPATDVHSFGVVLW